MKVNTYKIIYEIPTRTRFVGNKNTKEIHRLDAEDKYKNGCQIDTVLECRNAVEIKNPVQAIRKGWDFCAKCWGEDISER